MADMAYMVEALREAKIALEEGNFPIGCVICLGRDIISRAHNQIIFPRRDRLAHAELRALEQASPILAKNKGRAVLYTTYEPCVMCFGAAMQSRIKKIISGANVDKSGAFCLIDSLPKFYRRANYIPELVRGFMEDECRALFMKSDLAKKLVKEGLI